MESPTSRSPSPASTRRNIVNELQIGHHAAEQLRRRLFPKPSSPPAGFAEEGVSDYDLSETILNSFTKSLLLARTCDNLLVPRFSDDCKIEDSGDGEGEESSRIKDRRGCYKRRKRGQTWTTEDKNPADDGFAWRKYGQKMILNSKYPRNYYRCTHKTDQGCQAIKQVQQISADPPRYRNTYSGRHTCKNPLKTSEIILPSTSPDQVDSSILLSFGGSSNTNSAALNPFFRPSNSSMAIKQEQQGNLPPTRSIPTSTTTTTTTEAMMMAMMMINQSSSSDHNYLSSSDRTTLSVSGGATTGLSTPAVSDQGGDVLSAGAYSCSASPHSLEVDDYMMLGQDQLDHLIQFECDG